MAKTTSVDEMADLLAEVFEILKRHEQVLLGMTVDIQALANLP